jgi:hypothetical protein
MEPMNRLKIGEYNVWVQTLTNFINFVKTRLWYCKSVWLIHTLVPNEPWNSPYSTTSTFCLPAFDGWWIMGVDSESESQKLYSMLWLCIEIAPQNSPTIRRWHRCNPPFRLCILITVSKWKEAICSFVCAYTLTSHIKHSERF